MRSALNTSFVEVCRVSGVSRVYARDSVAVEDPLEIRLGQERQGLPTVRSVSVTMRTPGNDAELAIGFLFGEGILNERSDLGKIEFPDDNRVLIRLRAGLTVDFKRLDRNFYATSSCGICGKGSLEGVQRMSQRRYFSASQECLQISAAVIHELSDNLLNSQEIFGRTGGLHAAALFNGAGNLCLAREDVGRHNAVDKVVGAKWLEGAIPLSNRLLLVSGRASFELVQKAARAGIPILAAVGAPSSLAVELAQASDITLLGFVREDRFNIYSAAHRIMLTEQMRVSSRELTR